MRKISKEEILIFSIEQIAGLILNILQEIACGKKKVTYDGSSLESILSFEIVPIYEGINAHNGYLYQNGAICSYSGGHAPKELRELFFAGVELLKRKNLIMQDPTQSSSKFMILTDIGKTMKIDNNFFLDLERKPIEIIEKFKKSVFLMETLSGKKISCGSCFLFKKNLLVTCKHNISNRKYTIFFDKNTKLTDDFFNVRCHPTYDIAILEFDCSKILPIADRLKPIPISKEELHVGETLITMGYPLVAQRRPQLLSDVGIFQNYTYSYLNDQKYLTFSNKVDGGCSGGPVLSLKGKAVGIITELTEFQNEIGVVNNNKRGSNIYSHATPIVYLLDIVK